MRNEKSKAKKFGSVSDKTDSYLAEPLPTANSEEFVPKPLEDIQEFTPPASNDIYDFIPKLKTDKYKDKNNPVT